MSLVGAEGAGRRWLLAGAFVLLMLLWVLTVRIHSGATGAMARSDAAFDHGSLRTSLAEAKRAASWYLPFAAAQAQSYERLRAIAIGAEAEGEKRLALQAWEAIRGALLETSHPLSLGERNRGRLLSEANQQLARLLSQEAGEEREELRAALLASYQQSLIPSTERVISRSLGMWLILLTASALVFGGRGRWRQTLIWAPLSLGLLFWVFSAVGA